MSPALGVVEVGVDGRRAPLPVLERLLARRGERGSRGGQGGAGLVRLATCHRLELYTEGLGTLRAAEELRAWLGLSLGELAEIRPHLSIREDADAGRHLLRVAAGLESLVLGEDQIIGQVREAYRLSCEAQEAGPLLHRLFHAAFRAGKRARSETSLKEGARSLAACGVTFLSDRLGGLSDRCVLVLGAGEMGHVAVARLGEHGVGRLLVANRTFSRAEALAAEAGGEALPWAWRARALEEADGVICACHASEPVLDGAALAAAGRPIVVVDLAVPRGVEAPRRRPEGLVLADVEDVARHLPDDAERRRAEEGEAGRIVEEELAAWLAWGEARLERIGAVGADGAPDRHAASLLRSCNMRAGEARPRRQ